MRRPCLTATTRGMVKGVSFKVARGGIRLDAALVAAFPSVPRAFAREAVASGLVTVDGRHARKGERLAGGETVFVKELLEAGDNVVQPDPSVDAPCVFEDSSLLAFDKPAGMKVQPLSCREKGTLANGVAARWPECIPLGDRPLMAGALHRIDAGTSGLVMVARTAEAFAAVRSQFASHSVEKRYLALVGGRVAEGGKVECDLVHEAGLPFCRMADARTARPASRRERPMPAVTSYRPIACFGEGGKARTLLDVVIFTGVTHQIRAQLAMAGLHIVNDTLYGAHAEDGVLGHRLHALSATFMHPATGKKTTIATPAPEWANG